jgi:hypothetical protein
MSPFPRAQAWSSSCLLALALAACATPGPTGRVRNAPAPSPKAPVLLATPEAPASGGAAVNLPATGPVAPASVAPSSPPKADPSATPVTPLLPLRLGVALQASLVGAEAQGRLVGGVGAAAIVAPEGARLVALADGRILSNHAAGLISDHGGGLISDHGGGLISDHGGGLIGNNSSGLVGNNSSGMLGNNGAGYRLAQVDPAASQVEVLASGELAATPVQGIAKSGANYLWLVLALVDQQDQLLQAYATAQPRVGQWRRFQAKASEILPMPHATELAAMAVQGLNQQLKQQHYAGVMTQEADGPHLRMVWLPSAEAALTAGRPVVDLSASGTAQLLRARFVPILEENFGLQASASRFEFTQGPLGRVIDAWVGEQYLPGQAMGPVALYLSGDSGLIRRRVHIEAASTDRAFAWAGRGILHAAVPQLQRRDFYGFGFAAPGKPDLGVAYLRRVASGLLGNVGPFEWVGPQSTVTPGDGPATPHFVGTDGEFTASPSAALQALVPSRPPEGDAWVPTAPGVADLPASEASVQMAPWPSSLWQLPEAP